jgi:hypothetical protein
VNEQALFFIGLGVAFSVVTAIGTIVWQIYQMAERDDRKVKDQEA